MTDSRIKYITDMFFAIAGANGITRAGLSEQMLSKKSLMTVGKDVNLLLSSNLITERKDNESCVGRKATLLYSTERPIAVLDLSKHGFSLKFITCNGRILRKLCHSYSNSLAFIDNLLVFADKVQSFIESSNENLLAFTVILPGKYDSASDRVISKSSDDFYGIAVGEILGRILPKQKIFYCDEITVSVLSAESEIADLKENSLFLKLSDHPRVASIIDGRVYSGISSFRDSALSDSPSFVDLVCKCSDYISSSLSLFLPKIAVVEIPGLYPADVFESAVRNRLTEDGKIPDSLIPKLFIISASSCFHEKGAVRVAVEAILAEKLHNS